MKRYTANDKNNSKIEYHRLLMDVDLTEYRYRESVDDNVINVDTKVEDIQSTYTIEEAVEHAGFGWFQMKLIIFLGVLSAADAMEMLLLSILGPALQCEWNLSSEKKALITTIVFIGFFLGSFFWGMVSDNYGRKTTFIIVTSLMSYFGFLTAFSTTYIWVILIRGLVGFAIGGGASSFTLLSEFLPSRLRAKILILYQIWWACGSTFEVGLAYYVLPRYGWRWVVALSSTPLIVCAFLILLLPESPRFLLSVGRVDESLKIINTMLSTNKKSPMQGKLVSSANVKVKFNVHNLFLAEYRCTLLLLLILWFGVTFCYYGIVLLNAEFFNFHHECHKSPTTENFGSTGNITFIDNSCCQVLNNEDYKSMLLSSFGEFFIIPINFFLADAIGRKRTLGLWHFWMSFLFLILYICMSKTWATLVMFGIRGFASGLFNLTYIYTSEVFPTSVRSSATGLCSSFARIAAILTPFVAQVLMPQSLLVGLLVYFVVAFVSFISAVCLPIETKGRAMPQNFQEIEIEMDAR